MSVRNELGLKRCDTDTIVVCFEQEVHLLLKMLPVKAESPPPWEAETVLGSSFSVERGSTSPFLSFSEVCPEPAFLLLLPESSGCAVGSRITVSVVCLCFLQLSFNMT